MKSLTSVVLLCGACFLALPKPPGRAETPALPKKTALDDYVAKADPTYSWKLVKTIKGDGFTCYILDLKSQTWRMAPDVNRNVWEHWLTIVKPDKVTSETGLLMISGGRNGREAPNSPPGEAAMIAKRSGTVVVNLGQVPNQPLELNKDGNGRFEDDLIAYCHIKFMDTGDVTWLTRLPMVKSAVRAMDAATEFLATEEGGKTPLKKFVVAGASKRGWTTWLTGAVDSRVIAIVPIVIDVLNVKVSMMNHYAAYGFWAPAVGDYAVRHKVMDRWDTPQMDELNKIEDPYYYRHRLKIPKFIVNATGDQFFTPDSSKFYFDDLEGVKYLRYVPNADHSLRETDALESIYAFYNAIVKGTPLPKFSWKLQADGSIQVTTETKPLEVNLWQANSPKARDFRVMTIGKAFKKSTLSETGKGTYLARVEKPESGWTAFFVELVFDSGDPKTPFKFTTQVQITPDNHPHSFDDFRKTLKK